MAKPTDKSGLVCDWVILIGPFDPVFGSKGNAVGTKLAHGRQWEHICLQTWISMIVTWYLCVCVSRPLKQGNGHARTGGVTSQYIP